MQAIDKRNQQVFEKLFPETSQAPLVEYPKRHKIYNSGDRAVCLYIVKSGIAQIFTRDSEGKSLINDFVSGNRSQLLGIESLTNLNYLSHDNIRYINDAETITPVVAQKIPQHVIHEKLSRFGKTAEEQATAALEISLRLAEIVRARLRRQTTLQNGDSTEKFRLALLDIASELDPTQENGPQKIEGVTQDAIAEYAGVTRAHINHMLNDWVAKGLLAKQGRVIIIPNPQLIRNMHSKPLGPSIKAISYRTAKDNFKSLVVKTK